MKKIVLVLCLIVITKQFAFAESAKSPLATHDTALPIEIEADKLLVMQEDTVAVFAGNVEAKQGSINLRSDEMKVHYRPKAEQSEDLNAVERIDVKGNVFLSTPQETASGDKGYFNVDESIIVLTGDVVLTQKETIIKGDNLYYNMVTGRSEIKRNKDGNKKSSGRVRMVTQPSKLPNQ